MYLWIKFFHILIAVVSLGTSAGLGIMLELYGNHAIHGAYVLRAIRKVVFFVVIPGYILMLLSGAAMVHLAWSWKDSWLVPSLGLWTGGLIMLIIAEIVLNRQIKLFEDFETGNRPYKLFSLLSRGFGAAGGFMIVLILYYMVFKP